MGVAVVSRLRERGFRVSRFGFGWLACQGEVSLPRRCPAAVGGRCVGECRPALGVRLCAGLLRLLNRSLGTLSVCLCGRSLPWAARCLRPTRVPSGPRSRALWCWVSGERRISRGAQVVYSEDWYKKALKKKNPTPSFIKNMRLKDWVMLTSLTV